MNYLILNQKGSVLKDNFAAVNMVMKPAGYSFDVDELTRTIFIKDRDENIIKMINYKTLNDEITFDCELDHGKAMNFTFNVKNKENYIKLEVPKLGIYDIYVEFDWISKNRMFQSDNGNVYTDTPSIILKKANIVINDYEYSVMYDAYGNEVYLSKLDVENDTCYTIALSRTDDSSTSLTFKTANDESQRIIQSFGYEKRHKVANDFGFNEDYYRFEVYYHERKCNGTKIDINQNTNDDYKHYGNIKLVNNNRVREFLDEVIGKYKELFTYETFENGIIGGTLIKAYIDGEVNNSRVANNMLDAIGFPVKKQNKSRKRKNNK